MTSKAVPANPREHESGSTDLGCFCTLFCTPNTWLAVLVLAVAAARCAAIWWGEQASFGLALAET
jgi:hypothetical protein